MSIDSFFTDKTKSTLLFTYAPSIVAGTQASYALITTASLANLNPVTLTACASLVSIKALYEILKSDQSFLDELTLQVEKILQGAVCGALFGGVFAVLHRIAHYFYKMLQERQFIYDSKVDHAHSLVAEALKGTDLPKAEFIEIDNRGYFQAFWQSAHVGIRNFPKVLGAIQVYAQKIVGYEDRSRWVTNFDLNRFMDGERSSSSHYITESVPIYASCIGYKMPFTGWKLPTEFPEFKISNYSIIPVIAGLFFCTVQTQDLDV